MVVFCVFLSAEGNLSENRHPVCRSCRKKIAMDGGNTSSLMSQFCDNQPLAHSGKKVH